ncbi:protein FAM162B [Prorops nasuta]|uniref:protein FAM162B n=1 Tax=Prorops nasuta TaxID=863751 RepID=UPI0034CF2EE7
MSTSYFSKHLRAFHRSTSLHETKPEVTNTSKPTTTKPPVNSSSYEKSGYVKTYYRVSWFDKLYLVWIKRYPNMKSVPDEISEANLMNSRAKARVKTCNYMIVLTIFASIYTIYTAKKEKASGVNILEEQERRIDKIREEYQQSLAKKEN